MSVIIFLGRGPLEVSVGAFLGGAPSEQGLDMCQLQMHRQVPPSPPLHFTTRKTKTRHFKLRSKLRQGTSWSCSVVVSTPSSFVAVSRSSQFAARSSWGKSWPVKQAHSSLQHRCHLPSGLMIKSKDGKKTLPKIVPRRDLSQGRLGSQHGPPCWPCHRAAAWRACSDMGVPEQ